jgi:hypothetical protein
MTRASRRCPPGLIQINNSDLFSVGRSRNATETAYQVKPQANMDRAQSRLPALRPRRPGCNQSHARCTTAFHEPRRGKRGGLSKCHEFDAIKSHPIDLIEQQRLREHLQIFPSNREFSPFNANQMAW